MTDAVLNMTAFVDSVFEAPPVHAHDPRSFLILHMITLFVAKVLLYNTPFSRRAVC